MTSDIVKILQKSIAFLSGDKEGFLLEHRILNLYIGLTLIVFPMIIVLNMIIGVGWLANLPIAAVIILHAFLFYLARIKRIYKPVVLISVITWLIAMPVIFISCFGFEGGPAYMPVLLLLYICAITHGKTRYILLTVFVVEITCLYLLNFFVPQIFLHYATETDRFIDIFLTMLLINFLCGLILIIVKNEYVKARAKAELLLEKQLELSRKNEYFVKVFAHDMKNRLTASIPILELCSSTPQQDCIQEAIANEQEMFNMIANLINLFSEEKIILHQEQIAVTFLAALFKKHWDLPFRARGIDFVCISGNAACIWADKAYMELVWCNLLSNIVQHAPANTKVLAEFSKDDDFTYVSFLNSGELIPEEVREDLFNQYLAPEKQTAYHKSLGLNYSKMMCRLHGGDLLYAVENNMNKFTVKLPLNSRS